MADRSESVLDRLVHAGTGGATVHEIAGHLGRTPADVERELFDLEDDRLAFRQDRGLWRLSQRGLLFADERRRTNQNDQPPTGSTPPDG